MSIKNIIKISCCLILLSFNAAAKTTFLPEFTDSEFSFITDTGGNNHNTANGCSLFPLTSCPTHGNCSSCPLNSSYKKLDNCESGWKMNGSSCTAATCSAMGYESEIPANNICSKVTEGNLTCYKDCTKVSCIGYSLDCDNFSVVNYASKETCSDCANDNANCSPKLCKVSACQSGYKIADNGTTCIALDDTCATGYYKECESGTTGDAQYTEAGTACYQCKANDVNSECEQKCQDAYSGNSQMQGSSMASKILQQCLYTCSQANQPRVTQDAILYSDLTTAKEVHSDKTPIGIVFDEDNKLAIALTDAPSRLVWSTQSFYDVLTLTNHTTSDTALTDSNGKSNTQAIITFCQKNSLSCPAAEYAVSYSTEGTLPGQWYLPSLAELKKVYNISYETYSLLGTDELTDYLYWSSTEKSAGIAWTYWMSATENNKIEDYNVRPIINYGDTTLVCTPLKNDDECADWRQYPCDDGCGGKRKCCGPYYGYKYVSCTHWVAMCKQGEVQDAKESCKVTWIDSCDIVGYDAPECDEDEYYNCLDDVEFNQCSEAIPDSSSDFIYTAPADCQNQPKALSDNI